MATARNQFKTRAGSPVRVYSKKGGGDHPIHGAWYNDSDDCWIPCTWTLDGFFVSDEYPRSVDIIGLQEQVRNKRSEVFEDPQD